MAWNVSTGLIAVLALAGTRHQGAPAVEMLSVGDGLQVQNGDWVKIRFNAYTPGGKLIANSLYRGLDYTFVLGQEGSDSLLRTCSAGMHVGSRWRVHLDDSTDVVVWLVGATKGNSGGQR